MSSFRGPKGKVARSLVIAVSQKTQKALDRRNFAPGQHGQGRKKTSEYGLQLRAKQRARRFYGVNESQFHHYFEIAERKTGVTGDNLLRLLESRLDNIVYRVGFASSRAEARQLVGHGHFEVNGRRVDIASCLLKAGDIVTVCQKSRNSEKIKAVVEANSGRPVPQWIDVNRDTLEAKIIALPERDQIDAPVEEQLIVEFYSK